MAVSFDPRKSAFWLTKSPKRAIVGGIVFLLLAVAWFFTGSSTGPVLGIFWGIYALWQFASAAVTIVHRRRTGEVSDVSVPAPLAQESDPNQRYTR